MNVKINEKTNKNKENEKSFEEKSLSDFSINSNISETTKLKNEFKNINIANFTNPYRKKHNYNEMINDSKNLLIKEYNNINQNNNINSFNKNFNNDNNIQIEDNDLNENEISNKTKNKKYPKFIQNKVDTHYYFIDNNNKEWQFSEINRGEKINYFKCSTKICKGFGIIDRENKNSIFRITKEHSIKYYEHTYIYEKFKTR